VSDENAEIRRSLMEDDWRQSMSDKMPNLIDETPVKAEAENHSPVHKVQLNWFSGKSVEVSLDDITPEDPATGVTISDLMRTNKSMFNEDGKDPEFGYEDTISFFVNGKEDKCSHNVPIAKLFEAGDDAQLFVLVSDKPSNRLCFRRAFDDNDRVQVIEYENQKRHLYAGRVGSVVSFDEDSNRYKVLLEGPEEMQWLHKSHLRKEDEVRNEEE